MATKKAPAKQAGTVQNIIDEIAPRSVRDAAVRSIKLFFFVFIPLIPANSIIADADPAILKTALVAGVSAVFAYIVNLIFNWASSWDR